MSSKGNIFIRFKKSPISISKKRQIKKHMVNSKIACVPGINSLSLINASDKFLLSFLSDQALSAC